MATKIVFLSLEFDVNNSINLELGFSNGSPGGSTIDDLFPGLDGSNHFNSSWPHFFTQLGNKVIFQANDATHGRELWITDGTAPGTQLLLDINAVAPTATHDGFNNNQNFNSQSQIDFSKPVVIGNTAYFSASDGTHGFELWKTDGTPGGTVQVKNINTTGANGVNASNPSWMVAFNGEAYFVADDGTNHRQIWKSDGTDAGTVPITTLVAADANSASPFFLTVSGGLLYFAYYDGVNTAQQIYVTDGSAGNAHLLSPSHPTTLDPRSFTDINGTLYFTQNDGQHGYEIWKTNGTDAGTEMVADINTQGPLGINAPSSVPFGYTLFNGEIYFVADDGIHGFEVWKTDGTAAGTTMLKDINTNLIGGGPNNEGSVFSPFDHFVVFNNELYFNATDGQQAGQHGQELWKTDGTPGGTVLVADLIPGNSSGSPTQLQVIDGVLYFGSQVSVNNTNVLFAYDGVNPPVAISNNYHYGAGFEPFSFIQAPSSPVVDLNGAGAGNDREQTFTENGAPIRVADLTATIADADSASLDHVTVTLTRKPGDLLPIVGSLPAGITGVGTSTATTITFSMTGSATLADYLTALKQIRFSNTSENPDTTDRIITVVASDGTNDSNTATTTVHVVAVNDDPVNTVPAAQAVEANTATAIAGLSVADVDADPFAITTTLSVLHGTLTVASAGGATVSGSGTATVTLTGTVAQINTTLSAANNIVYKGGHDYFGGDTLTMSTDDGGHTGTGGVKTDTDQVAINLNTLIIGTPGNDSYTALPGQEMIHGLSGNDSITFNFKLTDATVTYEQNKVIIDGPNGSHTVLVGFETFNFTDGTVNNRDSDPLVDDLFYYSQNHSVWNAHLDADTHYHTTGWHNGLDPSAFFSTSTYLSANPDVKAGGGDPLLHFDAFGWIEGRVPSINFGPTQYLAANPDVAAAHVDPLRHYMEFGYEEGRLPIAPSELIASDGFDYVYHLQNNPDVVAAHVDPHQHFLTVGWQEGRNPNALFDVNGYLAAYSDVAAAHINPLLHYNQTGWKEGRDPSVGFDTGDYLGAYADVAAAHVNPLTHFLQFGIHEGRSPFADGIFG